MATLCVIRLHNPLENRLLIELPQWMWRMRSRNTLAAEGTMLDWGCTDNHRFCNEIESTSPDHLQELTPKVLQLLCRSTIYKLWLHVQPMSGTPVSGQVVCMFVCGHASYECVASVLQFESAMACDHWLPCTSTVPHVMSCIVRQWLSQQFACKHWQTDSLQPKPT